MIKNRTIVFFTIARIIAILFLIIAFTNQPYHYYKILRIIVFLVTIFGVHFAVKWRQNIWIIMLIFISVIYNPIFPIRLTRASWEIFNIIAMLILSYSIPTLHLTNIEDNPTYKYSEPAKTVVSGTLLMVGAFFLWFHIAGNIYYELLLIQSSKVASGFLISSYEDEHEDERGNISISEVGVYAFTTPDGLKYNTKTSNSNSKNINIEYLESDPSINRAEGDGCQTISEWLWRKIGIGGLFLIMVISPGFYLVRSGLKEIIALRRVNNEKY